MGNTLFAIGEALIDFIPAQTGCAFEEVTAFSPKSGGAPANVCGAFTILGGSSKFITQLGDDRQQDVLILQKALRRYAFFSGAGKRRMV